MEDTHLSKFISWADKVLKENDQAFLSVGVLKSLAEIYKRGHRTKIISTIALVRDNVIDIANAEVDRNMLQRKLITKLAQRIGLVYLPPRVPKWRYQRGKRSLLDNLGASTCSHST